MHGDDCSCEVVTQEQSLSRAAAQVGERSCTSATANCSAIRRASDAATPADTAIVERETLEHETLVKCVLPRQHERERLDLIGEQQEVKTFLQRRDLITKHQFALHLIRDSTVIPNYHSLNPKEVRTTNSSAQGPAQVCAGASSAVLCLQ